MNFSKIYSLALAASAAVFFAACSGNDDENTNITQGDENTLDVTPTDTLPPMTPTDSLPPADTSAVPQDTVVPFTLPEEAAEITPTVTITADTGKGLLVEDMEDGNSETLIPGSFWYTYDDTDNDGASQILTPVDDDGYIKGRRTDNGTNYAMAVYYKLDKGNYAYDPYVGWGFVIPNSVDMSRFGGITYWYKGGAHEIHIETSDVKDYDVHLSKMKVARAWQKVTIRFKDLTQGGWGDEVEFVPAHITAISFQAKGNGKVDSVLIDNIYLQDTSEVAKDTADMQIMDPEIPEVTIGDITISNPLQEKAMKSLNKGINITNWLEEDCGVSCPKFQGEFKFDETDVKLMADNGIKSLRFPIDLDQYVTNRDEFVAGTATELAFDDANLFGVLDSFVEWTGKYQMGFVIDYHEYDNGYNTKTATNENYKAMMAGLWKHVAAHFAANERDDIFYELLNEPDMTDGKVSSVNWRKAAQQDIDSIRTVDKTHTIIFGDASWYSISYLAKGAPLNDDNVVYAVHTYDPFVFTHQGADWADTKTIKNLMFPYDKEKWSEFSADFGVNRNTIKWVADGVKQYYKNGSKEAILKVVLPAKEWAVKNNVPVIINEFGAYRNKSDAQSVLNYLTALREISDTLQIPLQHWGYTGGFSLFDSDDGVKGTQLHEGIKEAYGL